MSAEYRFLRFEVVGLATIIFAIIGLIPIVDAAIFLRVLDADTAIAAVASLFLLSLPLGYAEHQIVVNVYRSDKAVRAVFEILEDMILEAQESVKTSGEKPFFAKFDNRAKNSFLTAILNVCIFQNDAPVVPEIYERLSERWSHFYARRAVGRWAPIFSISLWATVAILGYIFSWPFVFSTLNIALSIGWWIAVFLLCNFLINTYAKKLWFEISFLETSIVLAGKEKIMPMISKIVTSMVEHPEYIEKGPSYGITLYWL